MSAGGHLLGAAILIAAVGVIAPSLSTVVPEAPRPSSAPPVLSIEPGPAEPPGFGRSGEAHRLERAKDGHFYAEARVNGAAIRFVVDTGASIVALTPADAQRAGIVPGSERARARGAGGELEVIPVTIERLELGPVSGSHVRGVIAEDLPVSLLGQSFLSRLDRIAIEGDRMVLE